VSLTRRKKKTHRTGVKFNKSREKKGPKPTVPWVGQGGRGNWGKKKKKTRKTMSDTHRNQKSRTDRSWGKRKKDFLCQR